MADGIKYPTSDHIHADAEYEPAPYIDPRDAERAALRSRLDQLDAELRPPETPQEEHARLTAALADLGAGDKAGVPGA